MELVCLAGYMRLLSPWFVQQFPQRILNIHPSLLPAFPGLEAQEQAFAYGVKVSGCTVHFVDEELDHGAIIVQKTVPVLDGDDEHTLAARILEQEHMAYTEAIKIVLAGKFEIAGRRFQDEDSRYDYVGQRDSCDILCHPDNRQYFAVLERHILILHFRISPGAIERDSAQGGAHLQAVKPGGDVRRFHTPRESGCRFPAAPSRMDEECPNFRGIARRDRAANLPARHIGRLHRESCVCSIRRTQRSRSLAPDPHISARNRSRPR